MKWAALLALAVYAALKAAQLAFTGRSVGYRGASIGIARRLRRGEPMLAIAAAAISVAPVMAAIRYHDHKFAGLLRHATICQGLIAAYRDTPAIMHSNGEHAVYESFSMYRSIAFDAARQLGTPTDVALRRLDATATTIGAERVRADDQLHRIRLATTQRCLHPPRGVPNA